MPRGKIMGGYLVGLMNDAAQNHLTKVNSSLDMGEGSFPPFMGASTNASFLHLSGGYQVQADQPIKGIKKHAA